MALVGRRRELGAIERLLDRAAGGVGGHLVLTGPAGAGKTALADAAAVSAARRGLTVLRVAGVGAESGPLAWNQVLRDVGATELPDQPADADLDRAARDIAAGGPRLLLIDDVDRWNGWALSLLTRLTSRLATGTTAVLVTSGRPLGTAPELHLGGLPEADLRRLLADLPPAAVHAVWLATGGQPGPALGLAAALSALPDTADALTHLALETSSRAGFLDLDAGLVRLLEVAAGRDLPPTTRARVLARLARELLGDRSAQGRREELTDEAVRLARVAGDPETLAEVLDARLHALWDPAAAEDRLAVADEIVALARRAADARLELRGLFWGFVARAELGDLAEAEEALRAYARAGELAGDAEAAVVVVARQAMLATIRGRFDVAEELIARLEAQGHVIGLADTERLVASLRGRLALLRGDATAGEVETLRELARRLPGSYFEATAARTLAESGRDDEAALELERVLPAVLAGTGPRWLGAVADLGFVAARRGDPEAAQSLYDALLPYRGRLVVWGGANTITGPVDDYLGRLAAHLGRRDDARGHLDRAVDLEQRTGTLPWLAYTLAARAEVTGAPDDVARARGIAERLGLRGLLTALTPPADEWRLVRDGADWVLDAGAETVRLRDSRGVHYLRALLAVPGQEIPALDLVAGGAGLRVPPAEPVLDDTSRAAYRRRLATLDEQLDAADRAGDTERAAAVEAERAALLAELRRHTGLGGRPRVQSGEAERARVNATRALRATVDRIAAGAPLAGAHLSSSLHTGRLLRYQPAPGGPARWRV
ncbi:ATP-binding protein [Asanoa sp. WMMD1127]|uniref:AAA family ATPase n=1 Tax=Asanoa sp. WMMD1127 TaxID=3016107 RepID=UPI002415B598|nr:ATP-binding protein [Asanoa sp. WMMD1127]MDG4825190.1 ATP-binding protein [Asanoa sp. WMMD1127]